MWEEEIFSSFLAISADLHRTLPRLGLINSRPAGDSSQADTAAAAAAAEAASEAATTTTAAVPAAAAVSGPSCKETPHQDTAESAAAAPPPPETAASAALEGIATDSSSRNSSSSNSSSGQGEPVDAGAADGPRSAVEGPRAPTTPGAGVPPGPPPGPASRRSARLGGPGAPRDSQAVAPVPFGVAGGEKMETFLQTVLEAYVMLRPDLGYVQGMAFLAATLLLYMDEYSAFVCFANLMVGCV